MAQIGSFSHISFIVSDQKVLTPSNIRQKVSSSWGRHKLISRRPRPEFKGPDSREVTFTIVLDASLGVRPRETIEYLENMIEHGLVDYLVIGNRAVGNNRFYISSMTEAWDVVYNGGELARATLNITMNEYE